MLQSKQELQDRILKMLYTYNKNKKVSNEVIAFMVSKGITVGRAAKMFNRNIPVQMFSDMELRLLTFALYQALRESSLNPDRYFTANEIKEIELYKAPVEINNNKMSFENTDMIAKNQYLCSSYGLAKLAANWAEGTITVNKNTQKGIIKEVVNGEEVERSVLNINNIEDIKDRILSGCFFPTVVTLNILNLGEKNYTYDSDNRTLTVEVDNAQTFLNILDNLNIIGGALKATEANPNIEGCAILHILHFTEEEAKSFIDQSMLLDMSDRETVIIQETNRLDKEIINMLKSSSVANSLYNNIGEDLDDVIYNKKYVSFDTLLLALNYNFSCIDIQENNLSEYLIKGFNIILDVFKEEFNNIEESRLHSYIADNNAFIVYMAILARLQNYGNDTKWQNKLRKILGELALSRNNKTLKNIHLHYSNVTMPVVKTISDYFSKLVIEQL